MDRIIRLTDYLPPVLRQVYELRAIGEAEDPELREFQREAENVRADQFVLQATENGVARWEHILGIAPKGTDTLDSRKFRILTRLNEQLPYTIRMLRRQLASLCGPDGYSVHVDLESFQLTVKINLIAKSNYADVAELLERVVPLNILIDLSLLYNQHSTLAASTHGQLASFTHSQLRNEVLS